MVRVLAVLALVCGLVGSDGLISDPIQAGRSQTGRSTRWGLGWDEGIAVRYEFCRTWGVGLRLNPNYGDIERSEHEESGIYRFDELPSDVRMGGSDTDTQAFTVGLIVYRHFPLGRWFGWGPFAGIFYSRSLHDHTYRQVYIDEPGIDEWVTIRSVERETIDQTVDFHLGIRPTFRPHRRFLLETRFGISISSSGHDVFEDGEYIRYSGSDEDYETWSNRLEDCSWKVRAFGRDLLGDLGLSFIVFF